MVVAVRAGIVWEVDPQPAVNPATTSAINPFRSTALVSMTSAPSPTLGSALAIIRSCECEIHASGLRGGIDAKVPA
jgi:hypothetical protein